MTIRTPYNQPYSPDEVRGEYNDMPSCTVPDQTLPMRTILERYARGLPIEGQGNPVYFGEDLDLPNPATLDLSERAELKAQFQADIDALREKLYQQQLRNQTGLNQPADTNTGISSGDPNGEG